MHCVGWLNYEVGEGRHVGRWGERFAVEFLGDRFCWRLECCCWCGLGLGLFRKRRHWSFHEFRSDNLSGIEGFLESSKIVNAFCMFSEYVLGFRGLWANAIGLVMLVLRLEQLAAVQRSVQFHSVMFYSRFVQALDRSVLNSRTVLVLSQNSDDVFPHLFVVLNELVGAAT